tara:strand:- start:126 stop:452 length:327 start_codon:yes stop_codon:yes gene_type:complete
MSASHIIFENMSSNSCKLDKLEKKINTIEKKIDMIIEILNENLVVNCKKMGDHIDFVEKVYDNVKNPLGYICNKVNYLVKKDNYELDNLEDRLSDEDINRVMLLEEDD